MTPTPVQRSLFDTARREDKKPHRFFDLYTKNTTEAQAALYRQPLETKPVKSKSSDNDKPP